VFIRHSSSSAARSFVIALRLIKVNWPDPGKADHPET
jgi:hypothetical protein